MAGLGPAESPGEVSVAGPLMVTSEAIGLSVVSWGRCVNGGAGGSAYTKCVRSDAVGTENLRRKCALSVERMAFVWRLEAGGRYWESEGRLAQPFAINGIILVDSKSLTCDIGEVKRLGRTRNDGGRRNGWKNYWN